MDKRVTYKALCDRFLEGQRSWVEDHPEDAYRYVDVTMVMCSCCGYAFYYEEDASTERLEDVWISSVGLCEDCTTTLRDYRCMCSGCHSWIDVDDLSEYALDVLLESEDCGDLICCSIFCEKCIII